MNILSQRFPSLFARTPGEVFVNDIFYCNSVEDVVREVEGQPVESWKIENATAIPRGTYRITLENSPKFGPDTITFNDVEGSSFIRAHGGNDEGDTEGCVLVGYGLTDAGKIPPGFSAPALKNLKRVIKTAIASGDEVWWTIQ